ncbi:MAG: alpha-glucuronidase [Robiginitomaculum sp.]|nr:MAG: alpha-glucuronidase [Robiginitomaculum sp.]
MILRAWLVLVFVGSLQIASVQSAWAEDGYALWLRATPVQDAGLRRAYVKNIKAIVVEGNSPTLLAAQKELSDGLAGMLGRDIPLVQDLRRNGNLLLGTPGASEDIAGLDLPFESLGDEGYIIRALKVRNKRTIVITGNTDTAVLYGSFALLRHMQTRTSLTDIDIVSVPKIQNRILNHWDNMNQTVERGYAGESIWDWHKLPEYKNARYTMYARATASLGLNGTLLNNVNANAAILTPVYLEKVAALAEVFRPYGIKVYFSARFSAPIEIGGLDTADPLSADVQKWWAGKVAEIYKAIPDFGGFVVKANSEGQPGPQDYGRTHKDGANMMAQALKPHGGIVMWRAFVYDADNNEDRVKQAYTEFQPYDGLLADNVSVQAKNGPLDFQPREPIHPLFGALPKTNMTLELQMTKEYLGFDTHLAYLGPMYEEVLKTDTFAKGEGSSVAKVIDGSLFSPKLTSIAGVLNIGSDRNWSGSTFNQANWYVFGRMAWDPYLGAEDMATEWTRQTLTNDDKAVKAIVKIMMMSREAVVDYMTPLGLAHQMDTGHHHGPGPWVDNLGRDDWNPTYYHRADEVGIGFDRTASGSNAASLYHEPLASQYANIETVPENMLLWFHHVPWDYKMKSGETLWDTLVREYTHGVSEITEMRAIWAKQEAYIDAERFAEVSALLLKQEREAQWWRDASIAYFQTISKRPLPADVTPPPLSLEEYKKINWPHLIGY